MEAWSRAVRDPTALRSDHEGAPALTPRLLFLAQFFFLSALALPVGTVFGTDPTRNHELFATALVLAPVTAVLSVLPIRAATAHGVAAAVTVLDAALCLTLYAAIPGAGFAVLVALPIGWAATHFSVLFTLALTAGSIATVTTAPVARAIADGLAPTSGLTTSVNLAILFVLTAVGAREIARRQASHRSLAHRQSQMLMEALDKAHLQEQLLGEVLHTVDFIVITTTPDGQVQGANRAAHALARSIGSSEPRAVLDGPLYDTDRQTPLAPGNRPFDRALAGEAVDHQLVWLGHPGEQRFALSATVRPLMDSGVPRLLFIARDITADIVEADARDDLVTSVSHEIKSPLTSVLGNLELALEDDQIPPESRQLVEVALDNTERMLALSQDFLAARSESPRSRLAVAMEFCVPSDVARQAVEALRQTALERLVRLVPGPPDPTTIEADPLRLRQIVDNLLTNAIKYNVYGGRVSIDVRPGGESAVDIVVADTGRGMTADERRELFTRFYRTDGARASEQGTGLGLAITRDLVERHHGTIAVDSTPGEGTTVTVRLPIRQPVTGEDHT